MYVVSLWFPARTYRIKIFSKEIISRSFLSLPSPLQLSHVIATDTWSLHLIPSLSHAVLAGQTNSHNLWKLQSIKILKIVCVSWFLPLTYSARPDLFNLDRRADRKFIKTFRDWGYTLYLVSRSTCSPTEAWSLATLTRQTYLCSSSYLYMLPNVALVIEQYVSRLTSGSASGQH